MVVQILGGIGLFLLGMMLLTDGLKSLAGNALRRVLSQVVRGPVSGVFCGAGLTALVQSSSATTLATIGFVSAGLLTFTQSVGVVFGANIGTTSTGWIVSQLGFKMSIGAVAMPMILVGVVLRLLFRNRLASFGFALAGFGLIFVGLDVLQAGMSGLSEHFDPTDLPGGGDGIGSVLLLVGVGVVMTVVMQSSSAAVATTLAALHSEAIGMNQAAALVIGQNIGTTVTAVIASIGASVPARRTALAHILFNVFTAVVALLLLPVFGTVMRGYVEARDSDAALIAIAGFHTAFNLLGVALLLPAIKPYCRMVERILPQDSPQLTRFLDPSVLNVPPVAVEAARHTLIEIIEKIVTVLEPAIRYGHKVHHVRSRLEPVTEALVHTRQFLNRLSAAAQTAGQSDRLLAVLHGMDHVSRLNEVCLEDWPSDESLGAPLAREFADVLQQRLPELRLWFAQPDDAAPAEVLRVLSQQIARQRRETRESLMEETADGKRTAHDTLELLEAIRLIDEVTYHLWRSSMHLGVERPGEGGATV